MSDGKRNRTYWLIVLGSTLLTVAALFGLQEWYRTYMLVSSGGLGAEVGAEVEALHRAQREELASGRMPIERAMRLIAERGRTATAVVSPESSTDPGPASGWLHHPDYQAPPQPGQQEEETIPLGGGDDRPPVEPTRAPTTGTLNPQPGEGGADAEAPSGSAGQGAEGAAAQPAPADTPAPRPQPAAPAEAAE